MFRIDSSRCTGCGNCVQACPQGAISLRNNLAVINQEQCIRCGSCVTVCPVNAISEKLPVHSSVRDTVPFYTEAGKGGGIMRGRGWFGLGYQRRGRGGGRGGGGGRRWDNPFFARRNYAWLPRRWWAARPGIAPYSNMTRRPFGW